MCRFISSTADFEGLKTFFEMDLSNLTELSIEKLSVPKKKIEDLFNNMTFPRVKKLSISEPSLNSLPTLMGAIMEMAALEEIEFKDDSNFYVKLLTEPTLGVEDLLPSRQFEQEAKKYQVPSIKRVVLDNVKTSMRMAIYAIIAATNLFPNM